MDKATSERDIILKKRQERLAAALRANLQKRKAQQKEREKTQKINSKSTKIA